MQYVKQIDADNVNLSSFLSNINFIDHLCNLCDVLLNTLDSERKKTLFNEIKKINKILPANVYIPFVNHSIRNYVIASIPISEAKIFKTKERAPYMVTLECFRLDELNYYVINNSINISVRLSPEKVNEETYYQINNTETENKKEDNVSGISYLKNQSDFQIGEKIKKRNSGTFNPKKTMETLAEKIMNKTSISEEMTELGVTKTNIKNYSNQAKSIIAYLMENEVQFSKSIMIQNLLKPAQKVKNESKTERKAIAKVKNENKSYRNESSNTINKSIIINTEIKNKIKKISKFKFETPKKKISLIKIPFLYPKTQTINDDTFISNEASTTSSQKNIFILKTEKNIPIVDISKLTIENVCPSSLQINRYPSPPCLKKRRLFI